MNGRCDAEVGKPGAWHSCRRRATIEVWSRTHSHFQFCEQHESRAAEVKAPMSEAKPIRPPDNSREQHDPFE